MPGQESQSAHAAPQPFGDVFIQPRKRVAVRIPALKHARRTRTGFGRLGIALLFPAFTASVLLRAACRCPPRSSPERRRGSGGTRKRTDVRVCSIRRAAARTIVTRVAPPGRAACQCRVALAAARRSAFPDPMSAEVPFWARREAKRPRPSQGSQFVVRDDASGCSRGFKTRSCVGPSP